MKQMGRPNQSIRITNTKRPRRANETSASQHVTDSSNNKMRTSCSGIYFQTINRVPIKHCPLTSLLPLNSIQDIPRGLFAVPLLYGEFLLAAPVLPVTPLFPLAVFPVTPRGFFAVCVLGPSAFVQSLTALPYSETVEPVPPVAFVMLKQEGHVNISTKEDCQSMGHCSIAPILRPRDLDSETKRHWLTCRRRHVQRLKRPSQHCLRNLRQSYQPRQPRLERLWRRNYRCLTTCLI